MATGEHDPRHLGLEDALRRALEPHPLAVERLVRAALAGREPRRLRWPRLAAAAAFVLLLIFLIPDRSPVPPPGGDAPPAASAGPARISISNADGYVTISSTLGSKWILVPGDAS